MYCKKCGCEISNNQKFCTKCGEKVYVSNENKSLKLTINKNTVKFVIIGIVFITITSTIGTFYVSDLKISEISTYKSIIAIKEQDYEDYGIDINQEALKQAIEQDKNMEEFVKKLHFAKADNVFKTFYENLQILASQIAQDDTFNLSEKQNGSLKINNPDIDIIKFKKDYYNALVNREYIYNKYSKYLSKSWNKFLKLSYEFENDINETLANIEETKIIEWIVKWQKFLNKYPEFPMQNDVKNDIKWLINDILYGHFLSNDEEQSFNVEKLKNSYDEFLNKVDKSSKEYDLAVKCYEELKNNNFKRTAQYHKYLYDYTGFGSHGYEYELLSGILNTDKGHYEEYFSGDY